MSGWLDDPDSCTQSPIRDASTPLDLTSRASTSDPSAFLTRSRKHATKAKRAILSKTLFTTQSDIYDLCWSPTSNELATASVDNKVVCWDANSYKATETFDNHANYVQGVAWDPRDKVCVWAVVVNFLCMCSRLMDAGLALPCVGLHGESQRRWSSRNDLSYPLMDRI